MLLACHGILDRFAASVDPARDVEPRRTPLDIYVQLDRREHRVVHLLERRREDLKKGRARHSIEPAHDPEKRVALLLVGPLVDDRNDLAATFMDRSGPGNDPSDPKAAEFRLAMPPFLVVVGPASLAIQIGRA